MAQKQISLETTEYHYFLAGQDQMGLAAGSGDDVAISTSLVSVSLVSTTIS